MDAQYWVQIRGEITGPFTSDELMRMAAARKLRPDDKVSPDQKHWTIASRIPGLMAVPRALGEVSPEDEAKNFRAVPIEEDSAGDDGEYQLSPPEESPVELQRREQPLNPRTLPVGTQRFLEIPQRALGAALGGLLGAVIFFGSIPVLLLIDSLVGERLGLELAVIPLCALIVGAGVFLIATLGTFNTFEMDVHAAGRAHITLTKRFSYIPWSTLHTDVAAGDLLEKRVTLTSSFFDDTTAVDAVMLLLVVTCCALGGVPGLLFWIFWFRARGGEGEQMYRFRLRLRARNHTGPILLHQERTENYYATRFGTPEVADRMIKLLQAAVPELEVMEVEE